MFYHWCQLFLHHHLYYGLILLLCLLLGLSSSPVSAAGSSSSTGYGGGGGGGESIIQRFSGNLSHSDDFRLIVRDGDYLIIGSKNLIYNISLSTFEPVKKIEWYPTEKDLDSCVLKGINREKRCQNYIRVLVLKSDGGLFVCGTHAYRPKCRDYVQTVNGYEYRNETPGDALCPFGPDQNNTAIFAESKLYAATPTDRAGSSYSISRLPLQTRTSDVQQLNEPNFVNSQVYGQHVYFFFRENSVEFSNCGKAIYPRVARVCINDQGHPSFKSLWTSYHKVRLDCSIPGKLPFQFNELQSTSDIIRGSYSGRDADIFYGVFTTPDNALSASAICAYTMGSVQDIFDNGRFLGQERFNSIWAEVPESQVPSPRPGQCVPDSRATSDARVIFTRDKPLMAGSVRPLFGVPIIMQTNPKFRFTKITVDSQVETVSGSRFDVLFIGTTDGHVLKVINSASNAPNGHENYNKTLPVVITEIPVFPGRPVVNLMIHRTLFESKLIVVSDGEVQGIPLSKCEKRANSCGKCVALQDPYCAWDISRSLCTSSRVRIWNRDNFVQNVEEAWDNRCPDGRPPGPNEAGIDGYRNSDRPGDRLSSGERGGGNGGSPPLTAERASGSDENSAGANCEIAASQCFSSDTLAFGIVTSVVSSLVIGFIFGYIFSSRCKKDPGVCSPYADGRAYLDHRTLSRHLPNDSYGGIGVPSINKPINLVLNVPPKNGKNANSSADNKPFQKVKKIYL
ncbi:semaphorin-1A-like isoform X2 [Panonychus citri]|uniref:semaphorin-1A-like isoform X2 n=1 Tax=Panonychus citri TaxID=50023 RepID=UPI002307F00F|nr:semaphorin-1A-like isoform X2 [Panonychus citri]